MDDFINAYQASPETERLPTLSSQEQMFANALLSGLSPSKAAEAAGIAVGTAYDWRKKEHIARFIEIIEADRTALLQRNLNYSIEDAHLDIEMGKRMAANATEWFRGVELHMKLHGLGQKKEVEININDIRKPEQLQQLDDEELMKITGASIYPDAVEGDFTELE